MPKSADLNGDGTVDKTDLAALDQIILGTDLANYTPPKPKVSTGDIPPELVLPDRKPATAQSSAASEPAPTPVLSR